MSRNGETKRIGLKVGDLGMSAVCDEGVELYCDASYEAFLESSIHPDMELNVVYGDMPSEDGGDVLFKSGRLWDMRYGSGTYRIPLVSPLRGPEPYRMAVMNEEFSKGALHIRPWEGSRPARVRPFEYPLDEILLVNLLARKGGLYIHAVGVEWEGQGFVFCGVSGAGKSTLARLWKARGASILSDDRLVVRRQGGGLWLYGTPWHGDADLHKPQRAPLNRLHFLVQSHRNSLSHLASGEAMKRLMPCSFMPFYYPPGVSDSLAFIDRLVRDIPCYDLAFTPTQEAIDAALNGAE